MSETLVGTKADVAPEAEPLQTLHPEQQLVSPDGGVAEVEAMLDRPADATHAPVLSEREKRWELRKLHKAGLSHDIVAAKDENGKIMMTQGRDGQWRIKTRLNLNAYAKHHNDGYATMAKASGLGKSAGERLRDTVTDARAKLQAARAPKDQEQDTAVEKKTSWKTRAAALLGGLAVIAAAQKKSPKESAEPKATIVRQPVLAPRREANGKAEAEAEVTTTKEMPAVATEAKTTDRPERLSSRRKAAVAVLGIFAVGLMGLGLASDKDAPAGSETTVTAEEAPTDEKPNQQRDLEVRPAPDMYYGGAVPGEGADTDATTDISAATADERTQTLTLGGNIWDSSRAFLEQHDVAANNYNTDVIKDAVLAAEGLSEADATQLPVGYTFTIPADVLDDLK